VPLLLAVDALQTALFPQLQLVLEVLELSLKLLIVDLFLEADFGM
jgi:hypothetical protein